MKVNREKLLNDLETVKAGLSPREFIEQSSCFVFNDGMVMTFNDEVACRKEVDLKVTGAIQADRLLAILEKMDDPDLKYRDNEKGELEFRGKSKAFGVTKDAEIFLPVDRVEVPGDWEDLPSTFTEAVALVQTCVGKDESKFCLTCIHIHPQWVEACDNIQLMRVKVKTGIKKSILVRGASLKSIVSLGMDKVSLTENWIHFKNQDGLVLSCRKYMEDFPDVTKIVSVSGHEVTIPKGLAEASERAAVFATDKSGDPQVMVTLSEGVLLMSGEGLTGWYKEKKSVSYEGPPLKFLIAPDLMKHISEKHQQAEIGDNMLKVTGGSWTYVTVLGKVEAKEEKKGRK